MKREEFYSLVYRVVAVIPYGRVTTYGQIALMLGMPQYARLVGHALHRAPGYLELPCHRVVNSTGRLVPGWNEQRTLLSNEGVYFKDNGNVDLKRSIWRWDAADIRENIPKHL
ncbi:MGMT family protein [Caproiciproducens sp. R1]|uniref:MGMT family protein n=1 Tax=Caproiciproducens sp. R1 TaxID=3435000 RepID=UPI0040341698